MPLAGGNNASEDLSREAHVGRKLWDAGIIGEREFLAVVDRLFSSPHGRYLSTLHVLQSDGMDVAKAMTFLSYDSGIPLLPLGRFTLHKQAFGLLGLDFMKERGALVFDLLDSDLMVAVLNPYDTQLQEDVKRATGREAIFYLVSPLEFDEALRTVANHGAT